MTTHIGPLPNLYQGCPDLSKHTGGSYNNCWADQVSPPSPPACLLWAPSLLLPCSPMSPYEPSNKPCPLAQPCFPSYMQLNLFYLALLSKFYKQLLEYRVPPTAQHIHSLYLFYFTSTKYLSSSKPLNNLPMYCSPLIDGWALPNSDIGST